MASNNMNLFLGTKVRLAAPFPEDCLRIARFTDNYDYLRNVDTDAAVPLTPDEAGTSSVRRDGGFEFALRTLGDNRFVGFTALYRIEWNNRSARLAVGIGDPQDRGKGFGSDALALILRYAFHELNLNRVALEVISYNDAAIHAYRKAGFRVEGHQRSAVLRGGAHYDLISMALLADEWAERTGLPLSMRPTRPTENDHNNVNESSRLYEMEPVQPRIGVGAVIVNERNEVLLVWRNRQPEQHTWSIPGGKIDPYESAVDSVIREVKEEVGLDIAVEQLLCTAETIRPENQEHWISLLYSTRMIGGFARNMEEGGAIGEVAWFPLNDLPSPLASFAIPALDAVKKTGMA